MARRSGRRVKVVSPKSSEPKEDSVKVTGKKRSKSSDKETVKRKKQRTSYSSDPSDVADGLCTAECENDQFCWKCHKTGIELKCSTCLRSFHGKCLTRSTQMNEDNVCFYCLDEAKGFEEEKDFDNGMLTTLLSIIIDVIYKNKTLSNHLREWDPAPNSKLVHIVDYRYIMDRAKYAEGNLKYKSSKQLLNDVMWMLHNTLVMYSDSPSYVKSAKQLVESCTSEVDKMLNCKDCYLIETDSAERFFFYKPCDSPHPLVWAKMRFHPYWPALAYRVVGNKKVSVRFFGTYEVSHIPMSDCYFMSEKYPGPEKKGDKLSEAFIQKKAFIDIFETMYGPYPFEDFKELYDHRKAMDKMKSLTKLPTVVMTESIPLHSTKVTGIKVAEVESKVLSHSHVMVPPPPVQVVDEIMEVDLISDSMLEPTTLSNALVDAAGQSSIIIDSVYQADPNAEQRNVIDLGEDTMQVADITPQQNCVDAPPEDYDDDVIIIEPDDEDYLKSFNEEAMKKSSEFTIMQRYLKQDRKEALRLVKALKTASSKILMPMFNILFPLVQAAKHKAKGSVELKSTNNGLQKEIGSYKKKLKNADKAVNCMALTKEKEILLHKAEKEVLIKSVEELEAKLQEAENANNLVRKEMKVSESIYEAQIKKLKDDCLCMECKTEKGTHSCSGIGNNKILLCSNCLRGHKCYVEKSSTHPLITMPEGSTSVTTTSVVQQVCSFEYVKNAVYTISSQANSSSHMDHTLKQGNANSVANII